jgi:hypothetical protein
LDVFGFGVELSEQIRELHREADDLARIIPRVKDNMARELRTRVEEMKVEAAFVGAVKAIGIELKSLNPEFQPTKARATIHIEDPLFVGQLTQALEYVNGDGEILPGQKAGRSYSTRRGIVGRVWRSGIAELRGVAPTSTELQRSEALSAAETIPHIAQIWGMTIDEAKRAAEYHSCLGVPFRYASEKRAVFYMDSKLKEAFVPDSERDKFIARIIDIIGSHSIDTAIGDLVSGIPGNRISELASVGAN